LCKDEAKYVRYVRACKSDGRIKQIDIQLAIQMKKAHILGGGYREKDRRVSGSLRDKLIKKYHGRCVICGKPANEADHINGNRNSAKNLQLLCWECHMLKSTNDLKPIDSNNLSHIKMRKKSHELDLRVNAKSPKRECDNEKSWNRVYKDLYRNNRIKYYKVLLPFVSKIINKGYNLSEVIKILNNRKVPTIIGRYAWDSHSLRSIINLQE
jgi:5-methylcytosine-specific restriction endonuclease McrA